MNRLCEILAVIVLALASAQVDAAVYAWSKHDVTFIVPDGERVLFSSNTSFECRWDEMVLSVVLYNKSDATDDDIHNMVLRDAMGLNVYDTKEGKTKVKGFDGKHLEGTMPDGSRLLITTLKSKKSDLLIKVTINYLYGDREIVNDIVKSFSEDHKVAMKRRKVEEQHKQKIQKKSDAEREQKELEKEKKRKDEVIYEV